MQTLRLRQADTASAADAAEARAAELAAELADARSAVAALENELEMAHSVANRTEQQGISASGNGVDGERVDCRV